MNNLGQRYTNAVHDQEKLLPDRPFYVVCENCHESLGEFLLFPDAYVSATNAGWDLFRIHGCDFFFCPTCKKIEPVQPEAIQ